MGLSQVMLIFLAVIESEGTVGLCLAIPTHGMLPHVLQPDLTVAVQFMRVVALLKETDISVQITAQMISVKVSVLHEPK